MERTPLYDLQRRLGARFGETFGWELPRIYSDAQAEYRAATKGVALLDRSYIGRLRASGKDVLDLLNRLSTNKLLDLTLDTGMSTILTTNKGRILDLLVVVQMEGHLLLLTSPQNRRKVAGWIDRYTFLEEVSVEDVTPATAMLALIGPRAADLLFTLTGRDFPSRMSPHDHASATVEGTEVDVIRTDFAGILGFDMMVPASEAEGLWSAIADRGMELGLLPVGMDALETVRIEGGVPLYGRELSERFNPLEANPMHYP